MERFPSILIRSQRQDELAAGPICSRAVAIIVPRFCFFPLQGIVPLGGCKVEKVERGPKGGKFGLRITHPDFYAGRELILAQETSADQEAWLVALNNCSRV